MVNKKVAAGSILLTVTLLTSAVFTQPGRTQTTQDLPLVAPPAITAQLQLQAAEITAQMLHETQPTPQELIAFAKEAVPVENVRVRQKLNSTLAASSFKQTHSNILHSKARKWFPVIEPIFKAYGIPDDFKYVALVESGFAEGTSPKGARGIWQFMPGTARGLGLTVNDKVDERLDFKKSTVAAARYIKSLYNTLHNWTLVAAAYNVGDNHLNKQIRKQDQRNYYLLKLNKETAGYVYKLVSMKSVVETPKKYGYKEPATHLYRE